MAHQARKRFGQHFLTDESIIHAIVSTIHPGKDDFIIEIGPGLGAITYLQHLDALTISFNESHR